MMTTTLNANYITVSDEETFLLVGFADQEFNTSSYVMFQRAYEFDEQDQAQGMNTVYIERNDQGQSVYGGIERITFFPNAVRLNLSAQTAYTLGSDTDFVISIAPTSAELGLLRDGLIQLCAEKIMLVIDPAIDRLLAV